MCYRWRSLVRWGEGEELGVEVFFEGFCFGDEHFLFDVGVDGEILFEGLELREEDAVEGFVGGRRFVEADGLADVFELVFGIVVFGEEAVDGVFAAGEHEAGEAVGGFGGVLEEADIG